MKIIISLFRSSILKLKGVLKKGVIVFEGKSWIHVKKGSKIIINGKLYIGTNSYGNNGRNVLLRLDENSELIVNGSASFYYGCDIIIFKNAKLSIGNSFINSDAKIRCHSNIEIGDDCAISHDFTVMDSNAHFLNEDNATKPVVIKNHVWIGTRVTILSGVTIGEGAVIGANSLITKDVPPNTLVAGCPAKVIKENVSWRV